MAFYKVEKDGYILGVAQTSGNGTLSEKEYNELSEIIRSKPIPPDGYEYRLTSALEWELYDIPVIEESGDEATTEDYQHALREMGVEV